MNARSGNSLLLIGSVFFLGIGWYLYHEYASLPDAFPVGRTFIVEESESLRSISERLESEGYINSGLLFRAGLSFLNKDKDIHLGGYIFDAPMALPKVLQKFIQGKADTPLVSVTIPEGFTVEEIGEAFAKTLPNISKDAFVASVESESLGGYLFPSTYYPLPSDDEKDIISMMNRTFEREYAKFFNHLPLPPTIKNRQEVISLAAILEGEAKTQEDMKIVSGILQARLKQNMRLQVDVAPNTYKEAGLPRIPINNPGHMAIDAVFNPTPTDYLYYITGNDGKMYYAKTFDKHKENIRKYLK